MMIWRYRYHDDCAPSGEVNGYHYTKVAAEAAASKVEVRKPKGYQKLGIEQVDVPTTKDDLINWLNKNARNG
jgi:hypothetical protein